MSTPSGHGSVWEKLQVRDVQWQALRGAVRNDLSGDQDVAHPLEAMDRPGVELAEACGAVGVGGGGPVAEVHFSDRHVAAVHGFDPGDVPDPPDERAAVHSDRAGLGFGDNHPACRPGLISPVFGIRGERCDVVAGVDVYLLLGAPGAVTLETTVEGVVVGRSAL